MLDEPIIGTILTLGRTKDFAIRISKFTQSKEYVEIGAVGYQVLNTSTGVVEAEGSQLFQAIAATKFLQDSLDEARTPAPDGGVPGPKDIFNA